MRQRLARATAMSAPEVRFRLATLARRTAQGIGVRLRGARWDRASLTSALLAPKALSRPVTAAYGHALHALARGHWREAHGALNRHFLDRAAAFVLPPAERAAVAALIHQRFPGAALEAERRTERLQQGRYDLLGYRDLAFGSPPDWHHDPVHGTRSPLRFWADVPFLDAGIGDHKIIWELNRHQHWLALGRAHWLAGDRRCRELFVRELTDWLAANPPLIGINWASMLELAFRCLSWTWALHFFVEPSGDDLSDETPWIVDLLLGLDRQLTHIEQNLSYYFSPNTHLLGEGLALYTCGHAVPELAGSRRRVERGRAILLDGLRQQVDSDGGHRERSTHYHRYTLDFYLLALATARLAADPAAVPLAAGVERLAAAARLLADNTGRLPHIGDDDGGRLFPMCGRTADCIDDSLFIAAALTDRPHLALSGPTEEAAWMLSHPALRSSIDRVARERVPDQPVSGALPATGYFVSRSQSGDHAVIDGGPHGFLNGGHAHADALSCTLTIADQPCLIDPGTASYTVDARLRDRFRGTAAHNTLVIDQRPQSVPRGPFHWASQADARAVRWQTGTHFDYFEGTHDGYAPLVHRRHVLALHDDLFLVADGVQGDGTHRADVHWHVHPDWQVEVSRGLARLTARGMAAQLAWDADVAVTFTGDEESGLGWYSPVYGRVEPLTTLRLTRSSPAPFWLCTAVGLDQSNPITRLERLDLRSRADTGSPPSAAAFRIHRSRSIDDVVVSARPAGDAGWQAGDNEADARLLFCRREGTAVTRLVVVDGERVRLGGRVPIEVTCPQPVRGLHFVFNGSAAPRARISGASLGVQLRIGGQLLALAPERRAHVRAAGAGVR